MDNGQQWTTMDNNRQQWTIMDNNGQQWTKMDNNRQQWATIGNKGQQWATMGKNGQQWTTVFQFVRVFEGMSENCCVHVFKSCQNFFLVQKNVCDLIEPL